MKWKYIVTAVTAIAVLALSGCSAVRHPDTVSYVLEAEPSRLDPAMTTTLPENNTELQLFEGLTRLDEQDMPQPALAKSWEISPDGKTYTFHLRDGIRWSDGTAITAQDIEYSWKRVMNPDVASENAYMMFPIDKAEAYFNKKASAHEVGVTALDDQTLQVRLQNPTAYFLNLTANHCYYAVPRKIVEANPDTWASDAETMICSGPFKITRWIHSSQIDMVKNDAYWDADAVKLSHMEFPISDSQATRLTLVESNQANMTVEPPPSDQTRLEKMGLYRIAPYLGAYYYVFNVQAKPFDDVRVRRAFALAIQRQNLIHYIVRGQKQAAYAWVPPGIVDEVTGTDFRADGGNCITEDVPQAQQLLKEAGYDGDHPLPEVTVLFNTNEMHKAVAEAMQAMWKQNLGVEVHLMNQESKVFMASRAKGDYQIARASWIADYIDPMSFMEVFSDEENDAQYHNDAYNELIKKAKETNDEIQRLQYLHDAEKILFDDCVIIPIYYTTQPYVAQSYIKGYHWSPLGIVDFKRAYIE
jgi:oligopeptide transport system substrate-binding protein